MVVLNSYEIAQELLGKRPNTTSGRNMGYMMRKVYAIPKVDIYSISF
jgi:hypothetical protein